MNRSYVCRPTLPCQSRNTEFQNNDFWTKLSFNILSSLRLMCTTPCSSTIVKTAAQIHRITTKLWHNLEYPLQGFSDGIMPLLQMCVEYIISWNFLICHFLEIRYLTSSLSNHNPFIFKKGLWNCFFGRLQIWAYLSALIKNGFL